MIITYFLFWPFEYDLGWVGIYIITICATYH